MRKFQFLGAAVLPLALAACGGDNEAPPAPPYNGFVQPAGTVAVTFAVNDVANKTFTAGNLQWKGGMIYDSTTRKITKDANWGGPWAPLYDDGPYTAAVANHEGPTQTAGDHIWSVTVFVTPPATGTDTWEYGLNDGSLTACATPNATCRLQKVDGWIWKGPNGTFTVAAGETAAKTATGITFPAFGSNDVRFTIDTAALAGTCSVTTSQACGAGVPCPGTETCDPGTWDTSKIWVKGSAWAWSEFLLFDDGTLGDAAASDSKYTFQLGQYVPPATSTYLPHSGLTTSGDKPEFIFVFNGKEYKDPGGTALAIGVTADYKPAAGAWTSAPITVNPANKNTWISIP